jgi:hypothetical protein
VTRKTRGSSHKTPVIYIASRPSPPFYSFSILLQAEGLRTARPLGKTSSERDKTPILCLKGSTMYLEITCFQEIQNNLLKVMLELANFSFRVTCLY